MALCHRSRKKYRSGLPKVYYPALCPSTCGSIRHFQTSFSSPVGAPLITVEVQMSDGSTFAGTYTVGPNTSGDSLPT
jgi:hypothetical protein